MAGASEEIDPLIPGQFVDNIYVGFIMLENFGAVTDVMEEVIMLYANYIGDVFHKCVCEQDGNPNKVRRTNSPPTRPFFPSSPA